MEKLVKDFAATAAKMVAIAGDKLSPIKEKCIAEYGICKEKLESSYKSAADTVSHMEMVVYCKECAHSSMDGWMCNGYGYMPAHTTIPNQFCSEGVKEFPNG